MTESRQNELGENLRREAENQGPVVGLSPRGSTRLLMFSVRLA